MRITSIFLLLLLPLACAPGDDAPDGDAPPGTPLALAESPRLAVGEEEGDPDHELFRVRTPFLLPDGRLAVPLAGEGTIRIYSPDGALSERLGREGEGPGEFRFLSGAWARGDTIEAYDLRLRRITRFLPDRSEEIVSLDPADASETAAPVGDGWIVHGVRSARMGGRDDIVIQRFDRDGSHVGEVAAASGFHRELYAGGGGGPAPLSPRAIVVAAGDEIFVAETLTPRIDVVGADGSPLRALAWEPAASDPAAAFRAVRESVEERDDAPPWAMNAFGGADPPERIPVFQDFLVDAEGFVWIRPYEPLIHAAALGGLSAGVGSGGEWTILSPEGREVGRVRVPDGFEPARIGSEEVVGVYRDEWDVESVRVYPLRRG